MNILIINYNLIGDNNATGKTMSQLFDNLPDTNIMQLCMDPSFKKHEHLVYTEHLKNYLANLYYFFQKKMVRSSTNSYKSLKMSNKSRNVKSIFANSLKHMAMIVYELVPVFIGKKIWRKINPIRNV